jgi:hypothetical protein
VHSQPGPVRAEYNGRTARRIRQQSFAARRLGLMTQAKC